MVFQLLIFFPLLFYQSYHGCCYELLKKPKIVKNKENPKKYVFNIFVSFLVFSASSQKNLNF